MKKIDKNYKILVTPNKSKKIQEICFSQKIGWGHANEFKIQYINEQHLFIFEFCGRYNMYFCGNDDEYGFKRSPIIQIDADEFIKMYSDDSDSYTEAEEIVLEVSKELLSEVLNLKVASYSSLNKLNNSFDVTYMPLENNTYTRSMPININDFFFMCKEWAMNKGYQIISGLSDEPAYRRQDEKAYAQIRYYFEDEFGNGDYEDKYFMANTEIEAVIKASEYILKRIV